MELRNYHSLVLLFIWSCTLCSAAPPTIIRGLTNHTAVDSTEHYLVCSARGTEPLEFVWTKGDRKVSATRYVIEQPIVSQDGVTSSVMRITPLKRKKDRDIPFGCTVKNDEGEASSSAFIDVQTEKFLPEGFPEITEDPQIVATETGRRARMRCGATGTPTPEVEWFKDYNLLNIDGQRLTIEEGSYNLVIDRTEISDQGRYQCSLSNEVGVRNSPAAFLYIRDREAAPVIMSFPEDQVSNPGGSLNLTCAASGSPFPMVRWKQGETYIDTSAEFPGRNTLELVDIRESVTYTCEAANSVASVTKDVTITMLVPPATPTSLEVVNITPDSVSLSWRYRDLTPADYYTITYAPINAPEDIREIEGIVQQLYTVGNLQPRTEYVFRVSATNSAGKGEANEITALTHFVIPNAPSAPVIIDLGYDSVTLRWSHDNPNLVWSYIVEFRRTNVKQFTRLTEVSRAQLPVDGVLSPDTEYGFRVLAKNSVGISEPSQERIFKTLSIDGAQQPNPAPEPQSPPSFDVTPTPGPIYIGSSKNFTCSAIGNPVPVVQWYEGALVGGAPILQGTGQVTLRLENIQEEFAYTCYAYNANGAISSSIQVQPLRSNTGGQGDNGGQTGNQDGNNGGQTGGGNAPTFTFEPEDQVLERGGSKYILCSAEGNPIPDIRWLNNGNVVTESEPGTGYQYLLISNFEGAESYTCHASNSEGKVFKTISVTLGSGTGTGAPVTPPAGTPTPVIVTTPSPVATPKSGGPGNPIGPVERVNADSVMLRWAYIPSAQYYIIEEKKDDGNYQYLMETQSNEYLVENLQPFTDYTFRISYLDANGNSVEGSEVSIRTAGPTPEVFPQNLQAVGLPPTNGDAPSLQVTFQRPDTQDVITGYNVYYTNDPNLPFTEWGQMYFPESGEPEITGIIRNLYPDTTYYLSATMVNEAGEGRASYLATATTTSGGQPSVPNTPVAPVVRDVTPSSVTLIFTPARDIRSFILEYQESALLPDFNSIPGIYETEYTIGNLKPNTEYVFRVSGENDQGPSGPSRETTVTTSAGDVPVPTTIPHDIRTATLSSESIMLEWQPLHHTDLISYVIYYTKDQNVQPSEWERVVVKPEKPRPGKILHGLFPDTIYYVTVSALYAYGEGPTSVVHQVRTASNRAGPPRPPGKLLEIRGGLLPAPSQPLVDGLTATEALLRWQPGSTDPVDYYILEYFRTDTGATQSVDVTGTTHTVDRLEPYTEYVFRVYPVNASGRGESSQETRITTSEFPPGSPPENVIVTPIFTNEFQLQWDPPSVPFGIIRGYTVYYSPSPAPAAVEDWEKTTTPDTQLRLTGLQPDQLYNFRVVAFNSVGDGPASDTITARTSSSPTLPDGEVPQPPANIRADVLSPSSVHLSWDPSQDPSTSYIVEYNLPFPNDETVMRVPANTNYATIEDLQPSSEYAFRVRSQNSVGPGELSPAVVVSTPEEGIPAPPSTPEVVAVTDDSISITWVGSPGTVYYLVQYMNIATQQSNAVDVYETAHTLENLDINTEYVIRVFGLNSLGAGNPSDIVTVTTGQIVEPPITPTRPGPTEPSGGGPPAAPINLVLTPSDDPTSVTIQWFPGDNQVVDRYYIRWSNVNDPRETGEAYPNVPSYTVTQMTPGERYQFNVAAQNGDGISPFSDTLYYEVTQPETPAAPYNLQVTGLSDPTSVFLQWLPGDDSTDRYYYIQWSNNNDPNDASDGYSQTEDFTASGLKTGATYTFTVAAQNSFGLSPSSDPASYNVPIVEPPQQGPAAPINLKAQVLSDSNALVEWQPGDNNIVESYYVRWSNENDPNDVGGDYTPDTRYEVPGLQAGATYVFIIAAVNQVGFSPYSERLSLTMEQAPPSVPAPINVQAIAHPNASVSLTWLPGDNTNIDRYFIRWSNSNDPNDAGQAYQTELYHTVDNLQPGATYNFNIASETRAGVSPFSDTVSVTLRDEQPGPAAPHSLRANQLSDTAATLDWLPGDNSVVDRYHIRWFDRRYPNDVSEAYSPVTSYDLTGLTTRATYTFQVSAQNQYGSSPFSDVAYLTLEETSSGPAAPYNLEVRGLADTSVSLQWLPGDNTVVDRYYIRWSNVADPTDSGEGYSPITSYEVAGLQPGQTYTFNVAAVNQEGSSPFSETASYTVEAERPDVTLPAPTTPEVLEATSDSFTISWQPGSNDQVYYYTIEYTRTDTGDAQYVDLTDTSYTITGLEPDTEYAIRVFPFNQAGRGQASGTKYAKTKPLDQSPPPAPARPDFSEVTATSVTLTWNIVEDTAYYVVSYERPDTGNVYGDIAYTNEWTVPGLESDTYYTFNVKAVNEYGSSNPSESAPVVTLSTPGPTTQLPVPGQAPDTPESVYYDEVTSSSITLRWNAVPNTNYYILEYHRGEEFKNINSEYADRNELTFDRLEPNTLYTFRVRAVNGYGSSDPSIWVPVFTKTVAVTTPSTSRKPEKPSQPQFTEVSFDSLTMSWNSSGNVAYFFIRYERPDTGEEFNDVSYTTQWTIVGLIPDTLYIFEVTAYNDYGSSGPSESASVMTLPSPVTLPPKPRKPDTPSQPKFTAVSFDSVTITWNSTGDVTYFIIRYWDHETNTLLTDVAYSDVWNIVGLKSNTQYSFEVRATNAYGTSDLSPSASVFTLQAPVTPTIPSNKPAAPSQPEINELSINSVTLIWNSTGDITYFIIEYQNHFTGEVHTANSYSNRLALVGLQPDTYYTFTVIAVNDYGRSDPSPRASVVTLPAPEQPTATPRPRPPEDPSQPEFTEIGLDSVTMTWHSSEDVTYFIIEYETGAGEGKTANTYTNELTLVGLEPGTYYSFTVTAINDYGRSAPSPRGIVVTLSPVEPTTSRPRQPTAPSRPEFSDIGVDSITMTWYSPGDVTYYIIEYETDTGDVHSANSYLNELTLVGLEPDTYYTFTITAVNDYGRSDASPRASVATLSAPVEPTIPRPRKPAIPSKPVSTEIGFDSVTLTWNSTGDVTYFIVEYQVYFDAEVHTANSYSNMLTLVGLQPDTYYAFRVTAVNDYGRSDPSPRVPVVTLSVPVEPTTPRPRPPAAPSRPEFTELGFDSVAMTWNSTGDVTYFIVEYQTFIGQVQTQTANSYSNSLTLIGLRPETIYTFMVTAVNEYGRSDPSQRATVVTLSAPVEPTTTAPSLKPATPSRPEFTEVNFDSITMTWNSTGNVAYYIIQYERTDTGDIFSDVSYNNEWTVVGLEPETFYRFEVSAVNEYGNSGPSEKASVFTIAAPDTPERLNAPTIVDSTKDSVTLRWEPSTASYLDYYILEYWQSEDFQGTYTSVELRNLIDTEYTVRGLEPDTGYGFRVSAVNVFGRGEHSTPSYVRTSSDTVIPTSTALPTPTIPLPGKPDTPSQPEFIEIGSNSVKMTWNSTGEVTYFIIEIQHPQTGRVLSDVAYINTWNVAGLEPNSYYTFRVLAVNAYGRSGQSERASVFTLPLPGSTGKPDVTTGPGTDNTTDTTDDPTVTDEPLTTAPTEIVGPSTAPTGIELDLVCADTVVVFWEPLDSNDTVIGYQVYYFTNEFDAQNVSVAGNKRYVVVKGLEGGLNYTIAVSAITAEGEGPESEGVTVETEVTVPDVLLQDITAEWISSNETDEILVTWRYGDVMVSYSDAENREEFNETISNTMEYLIPDVLTGTTYDIELKSGSSTYLISVQTYEDYVTEIVEVTETFVTTSPGEESTETLYGTTSATVVFTELATLETELATQEVETTAPPPTPTRPQYIKEVEAFGEDDTTVRVYWYPLKDPHYSEMILGYTIQYRDIPEPEMIRYQDLDNLKPVEEQEPVSVNVDPSQVNFALADLQTGGVYQIVVYANTTDGMGPGSVPVFIKVEKDSVGTFELAEDIAGPAFLNYIIRTLVTVQEEGPADLANYLEETHVNLLITAEMIINQSQPQVNTTRKPIEALDEMNTLFMVHIVQTLLSSSTPAGLDQHVSNFIDFWTQYVTLPTPTVPVEIIDEGTTPRPTTGLFTDDFTTQDMGSGELPTAPSSAVKEVTMRQVDSQTVRLQWFPPKDQQENIKFYVVTQQELDKNRKPVGDPKEHISGGELTYDLKELTTGTEYEIRVLVANSEGRGPASSPIYVKLDKDQAANKDRKELPQSPKP